MKPNFIVVFIAVFGFMTNIAIAIPLDKPRTTIIINGDGYPLIWSNLIPFGFKEQLTPYELTNSVKYCHSGAACSQEALDKGGIYYLIQNGRVAYYDRFGKLVATQLKGPGTPSGSINTLPVSPTYTYRIPTSTELVVGGNNELSTINEYVWESTGSNPVTHNQLRPEKYALGLQVGDDNSSHMYQKIPTKAGRTYVFKATSYAFSGWAGQSAYFTVESSQSGPIKANILGESNSRNNANSGITNHTFEFVARGEETYVVARSDSAYQRVFVESISVKEKNITVPFTTISTIKHDGITLPFENIKKWRVKTGTNSYSGFTQQTSGVPKPIRSFRAYDIPLHGILNRTDYPIIVGNWASESKTAVHWAVRGLIEKNHSFMGNSVQAIDVWATRFKGLTGFGAATNISWMMKEYANAIEIILHNDIGYTYPAAQKENAEHFLDTMYSIMLREDGREMLESGRLGGNWVSSQIMSKLAYWVVKHSFATTNEEKQIAINKFNFFSGLTDSLFVSQIYMNSDPLGLPNSFYDKGLDLENGTQHVGRIYGGDAAVNTNGIWYIGTDSTCFQYDGLVEEYYRDIGHAHMGLEPVFNIAQILYLQDGENMFERHKERLIKASEVLQETHLAALNIINRSTGVKYENLPKPECNANVEVRMTEVGRSYDERNARTGALYSSQIYGYAKQFWSDWRILMPVTHATTETYRRIELWDTGIPAVYLEAFFLTDSNE